MCGEAPEGTVTVSTGPQAAPLDREDAAEATDREDAVEARDREDAVEARGREDGIDSSDEPAAESARTTAESTESGEPTRSTEPTGSEQEEEKTDAIAETGRA